MFESGNDLMEHSYMLPDNKNLISRVLYRSLL